VINKIDQNTGEQQLLQNMLDEGNWTTEKTEKRIDILLKKPTIQKLFDSYFYDYSREKHKYQNFEENSEQSWYLDEKGNIRQAGDKNEDNEMNNMIGDQDNEKSEEEKLDNDDKISL